MTSIMGKLANAQSVDEVAAILKAEGQDEAMAERAWQEVCHAKEESGKELSLDELDAVAGGREYRDWLKEGCVATVEPGSNCWGDDGGCYEINIHYLFEPYDQPCVYCGARYTYQITLKSNGYNQYTQYECRDCGAKFRYIGSSIVRVD